MKAIVAASCLVAGCFTSEPSVTPLGEPRWAIALGGRANDEGVAVATDSIGDVIAGGNFTGPADLGSGLETVGGPWAFITKRVASDGAERWTHKLLGTDSASGAGVDEIAIGLQDSVIVVGHYWGTIDFGGQSLTLPPDTSTMFVANYSWDGQLVWLRTLTDNAYGTGVAVDSDGRIFVTGTFTKSALDFNGTVFRETEGDPDTFLVAYDAQGTLLWGTAFQASAPGTINGAGPVGNGIAVAANGDVLVTGTFTGPASLGGAVLEPEARIRTFLTRFRNDGLYLSSRAIGPIAPYSSRTPEITVHSSGRIVIQHIEDDESGAATGPTATPGLATIRVFDDDANELWGARLQNNGSYSPQMRTLTATPGGHIVTSAWVDAPYNADNRSAVSGLMEVVAYDAAGNAAVATFGSRLYGAPHQTMAAKSAASASGAIAFTGAFAGMIDFGTGAFATHGQDDTDIYIVAVDPPPASPH